MAVIHVRGLKKRFGDHEVVKGIDLRVEEGEIFGLIGPDGAGKSTLIRMIAGILKPTAGEIYVHNIDVIKDYEKAHNVIGYMPQIFGLYGTLTVEENLRFVAGVHGVGKEDFQQRSEELYRFSGLGPFRDRRAAQLSGGMRQKLGLCCVLIHQPKVLLLDEPTVGVDPLSRHQFWDILHNLCTQGTTILISTPYMEEADRCHRIAFLEGGEILELLDPRKLKAIFPYITCDIYTGHPRNLLYRLRERVSLPASFLSGDHIHLICEKDSVDSGQLEAILAELCPEGAQLKKTAPVVQDLYFILEKGSHGA